jgi:hypothetical protein
MVAVTRLEPVSDRVFASEESVDPLHDLERERRIASYPARVRVRICEVVARSCPSGSN